MTTKPHNYWNGQPFPWSDYNPCSPKDLSYTLKKLEAAPRKHWSQNFLMDLNAQQRIIQAANIQASDYVWEIGPGMGALTQHLWGNCYHLTLFEIDPILLGFYRKRLGKNPEQITNNKLLDYNVDNPLSPPYQLIGGDVTKTWRNVQPFPNIVISNLPYNTASLIMSLFAQELNFRPRCMVFTVQKEMAERIMAKKHCKNYSSFSILMQTQFRIENLFDLPARLFYPKPNINSTTIRLKPREHGLNSIQVHKLTKFTQTIFSKRRKTIANNIKSSPYNVQFHELESHLNTLEIQCNQRAEEISIEQFIALGKKL